MKRGEFDHVIRAAAKIVEDEIVVIGSQAVLGQYPDSPEPLLKSLEVDLFPLNDPERSEEIDGAMGDGSPFHEMFGYYAHGVGPETLTAPAGWEGRLVRLELPPNGLWRVLAIAWCLEAHDLVLAKLAAGRSHDLEFAEEAIRHGLVDQDRLQKRIPLMPESHREVTGERLAGVRSRIGRNSR